MRTLLFLSLFASWSAQAQFDGRGHSGKILRAYVVENAGYQETMFPGTEHHQSSEAVYPPVDVTVMTQAVLKMVGNGVKAKTGEAIAFACIGAGQTSSVIGPDCSYLRAIFYNSRTQRAYAFGQIYYVADQNLNEFFKGLKESWQQVGGPKVTANLFIALQSEKLTHQDGWNWSINPRSIAYRKFLSLVAELEGAKMAPYAHVRGMVFSLMIQPKHPSPFSRWHSTTGGYGPNGGYYSTDQ